MRAEYHKDFVKQFSKLPQKQKARVISATELFLQEPEAHKLRNHALTGEYRGQRSVSAGGDLRLHYIELDGKVVLFVAVGTHSQLY